MQRATIAEQRVYESWLDYQAALLRAIAPLTAAQMNQRPMPGQRSIGEIAEHIVFGRALWLSRVLGDGVAELEPMLKWDDADDPPRTVTEVLHGLEVTWQVITAFLMRGSATDEIPDDQVEGRQIIWGMLDHDLPHCGELSFLLGACGLPGVEL